MNLNLNWNNFQIIKNSVPNFWENIFKNNARSYEKIYYPVTQTCQQLQKQNNNIKVVSVENTNPPQLSSITHLQNTNNQQTIMINEYNENLIEKTFYDIRKILSEHIQPNNNSKERINLYDILFLISHKLINEQSYQDLTDDIFESLNVEIGRNKISNKLNLIDENIILNINNDIINYIKKNFDPIYKLNHNICGIDGSDLCADAKLSAYGYDLVNTHKYSTPYSSFITNYNYGIIENIITGKKYNERRDSNILIKQAKMLNTIYLEDAGYFSHAHANTIHKSGNFFIMRLPADGKLVKSIKHKFNNNNVIDYRSKNNKFKIIRYYITNCTNETKTYYVITNNLDLTQKEISDYYHFRWDTEVKINIFKNKLGGNYYSTRTEKGFKNIIRIQHFIFLLSYIFSRLSEKVFGDDYGINKKINEDKTKKEGVNINKSDFNKININSAIRTTANSLLFTLIYESYDKNKMHSCLKKIHKNKIQSILGRHFIHNLTKNDISNKRKEHYKQYSKNNVKSLYDVCIYKNYQSEISVHKEREHKELFVLRFD